MIRRITPRTAALAVVLVGLAGCASKGNVAGKVTFNGKAVTSGSVSLFAADDIQYSGQIEPDGTYSIPDVPLGPVKIVVSSPNPGGASRRPPPRGTASDFAPEPAATPTGGWFPLPEKYASAATSPLTGEVKGELTPLDIELK